jgi:hypothetical protein
MLLVEELRYAATVSGQPAVCDELAGHLWKAIVGSKVEIKANRFNTQVDGELVGPLLRMTLSISHGNETSSITFFVFAVLP